MRNQNVGFGVLIAHVKHKFYQKKSTPIKNYNHFKIIYISINNRLQTNNIRQQMIKNRKKFGGHRNFASSTLMVSRTDVQIINLKNLQT